MPKTSSPTRRPTRSPIRFRSRSSGPTSAVSSAKVRPSSTAPLSQLRAELGRPWTSTRPCERSARRSSESPSSTRSIYVLQRLVESARGVAGAWYAALAPDGAGGFRRFLTAGMSDELIASLGPLPPARGPRCDAREPRAVRDKRHPRASTLPRLVPKGHPERSFLGVLIVAPDGVIGAFYLTEKLDAPDFTRERTSS